MEVPLPPPAEQAAIARILDAVDTAIEKTRAAVERAEELRESLLDELLSVGLDAAGRARSREKQPSEFERKRIGFFPRAWKDSAVGTEFELQNGLTLNEQRRSASRRHKYLRVANVQRDRLLLDDVKAMEASERELAPRLLEVDDLLVVEGHADPLQIGRCARVTSAAVGTTFQNHLFRLRTRGEVLPAFGCLWLNSQFALRYWNAQCATSSGLNTINQRALKRMGIPVPPVREQERIVEIVGAAKQQRERLGARVRALAELKRALAHDLLTGAVRVHPRLFEEALQP